MGPSSHTGSTHAVVRQPKAIRKGRGRAAARPPSGQGLTPPRRLVLGSSMSSSARELVLILDFGAQYTQLIARRIREQRVYCEIHPCTLPFEQVRAMEPRSDRPVGRPGERLRARARPRSTRGSSSSGCPSSASATGCSSSRTCSAAGSSARAPASTATRASSSRGRGHLPPLRQARGARRLDVARRPHRRAAAGLPDHRRQRQHALLRRRQRAASASTASSSTPRSSHTPRGRRHARVVSLRRGGPRGPRGRPASSPKRPSPPCARRSRAERPRHLRAVGRRRLVGRGRPLPQGARATGSRASSSTTACCGRARRSRWCATFRESFRLEPGRGRRARSAFSRRSPA